MGLTRRMAREMLESGCWSRESIRWVDRLPIGDRRIELVNPHTVVVGAFSTPGDNLLAFYPWSTRPDLSLPGAEITAYSDGSGTTSEKQAGIGVAVYWPWGPELVAQNIGRGTNNRAELCALWRAASCSPMLNQPVTVYSDSEYAIGSVTQDWNPSANAGLIRAIRADLKLRRNVRFEHVPGHEGHEGNEVADGLAKIGRKHVVEETWYPR